MADGKRSNLVTVRVTDDELKRCEQRVARLRGGAPGVRVTRSDAVRHALLRGLDGDE